MIFGWTMESSTCFCDWRLHLFAISAFVLAIPMVALFQPGWQSGILGGAEFSDLAVVACSLVQRCISLFAPDLIHSSAESLHGRGAWWLELV